MAEVEKTTKTEEVTTKDAPKAKDEKKKASKANKPSLGARVKKFFKDNKSELHKVTWYSKKDTIKSTGLVIVVLVVASTAISLVDIGLNSLIMWLGSLV